MKNKPFEWATRITTVIVLVSIAAVAQNATPKHFRGVINAYSPQTTSTTGTTGPYEVRGPWSLKLNGNSTKANFSAALNMELSDGWVITENGSNFDPIAEVPHSSRRSSRWGCLDNIYGRIPNHRYGHDNTQWSPAPISPSPVTIEITGGTQLAFSNITLTFGVPGSNHFGTEPLSGIVQSVQK